MLGNKLSKFSAGKVINKLATCIMILPSLVVVLCFFVGTKTVQYNSPGGY